MPSSLSFAEVSGSSDPENRPQAANEKAGSNRMKAAKSGSKQVYLRIDDEGITNMNQAKASSTPEDITALIRRKLKDLPKIV
jgi:hypothetical protein